MFLNCRASRSCHEQLVYNGVRAYVECDSAVFGYDHFCRNFTRNFHYLIMKRPEVLFSKVSVTTRRIHCFLFRLSETGQKPSSSVMAVSVIICVPAGW